MPQYFVSTTDCLTGEVGVYAADHAALSILLRRTLSEIMRDEGALAGRSEFAAQATDENGQSVMKATISLSVVER